MWAATLAPDPDIIGYSAGISACEKGGQWQQALSLLSGMRERKLEPNVIFYSAGVSACEKSGRWEQALHLLIEAREVKLELDVISITMLRSARARKVVSGRRRCLCSARCRVRS
ncbi:unnamed protein product [Prorocentrum cordatum]|uniref:Pentatricopeptide repeat-containing protein n=1 Tax=Prorocentrum cordatum TaxID=2364126 RepID=A0ABN9WSP4_9DINO|nr:unnamed protein product [Polarella glacialis]